MFLIKLIKVGLMVMRNQGLLPPTSLTSPPPYPSQPLNLKIIPVKEAEVGFRRGYKSNLHEQDLVLHINRKPTYIVN